MNPTDSTVKLKVESGRGAQPLSDALVAMLRRRVVSRFYDQRYVTDAIARALVHEKWDGAPGTGDKDN